VIFAARPQAGSPRSLTISSFSLLALRSLGEVGAANSLIKIKKRKKQFRELLSSLIVNK